MSLKLLQTIAAAFARASNAYHKDAVTQPGSGNPRYEDIGQVVRVSKERDWNAGVHNRTKSDNTNTLKVSVEPTFTRATSGWVDGVAYAANTPRYVSGGILIEESSTNLLLDSSYEGNPGWYTTGGTVNSSASTQQVFHGSSSLKITGGTANARIVQNLSLTANTTYTFQYRYRIDTPMTSGSIEIGATNDYAWAWGTRFIIPNTVTSGWVYKEVTFTTGSTIGEDAIWVYVASAASGGEYYFDAFQLEQKPYATSFIPTTTASVTRSADALSSTTKGMIDQGSGKVKIRFNIEGAKASGNYALIDIAGDYVSGGLLYLSSGRNVSLAIGDGTQRYYGWGSPLAVNTWHEVEFSWSATGIIVNINGTDYPVSVPQKMIPRDTVYIGGWPGGGAAQQFVGLIDYVEFYNKNNEVTRFEFNNTIAPNTNATWTSPWYDSTVSGCIWSDYSAPFNLPVGTSGYIEFRTSVNADGSGASAWLANTPATGQYIQARITLNPNGVTTYPTVDSLSVNLNGPDYGKGIIIEETTTNLLVAPTVPATENITVSANGDYTLSVYGTDASSGSVNITHERFEDAQADFNTGTLVGVEALSSGAIALKVEADPAFTRATAATKKDFTQVASGNVRFEELVTTFKLDLQHEFDAGTKEGVTTTSGAVTTDFTPTFTRATTATSKKLQSVASNQIRYDDLVSPIILDTDFDFDNSGTKEAIVTNGSGAIVVAGDPTFTRASSGYLADGTIVASGAPRYEKMANSTTVTTDTDWNSGTHEFTAASAGDLTFTNFSPVFARNTVAYKKDGTQVASGVTRYEIGKNFISTKNKSDFETDLTGVSKNSGGNFETITRDTIEFYEGTASVKVVTTADSTSQGIVIGNSPINPGFQYTASVWMKGSGTVRLRMNNGVTTDTANITLTNTWTRYSVTSAVTTGNAAQIVIYTVVAAAGTFYVDAAQIEQGTTATTWTPGGESAIMIEESTGSGLTANQSNVETDLTGFTNVGSATITRDTTEKWEGTASVKIVTAGGGTYQGVQITPNVSVTNGQAYTFSAYVKGTGTAMISLSDTVTQTDGQLITLTSNWQRISVTKTMASTFAIPFIFASSGAVVSTIYADGMQLEQKSYATSWMIGSTARFGENLSLPAGAAIDIAKGAIIMRLNFDGEAGKATPPRTFSFFGLNTAGSNAIYANRGTDGNVGLAVWDGSGNVSLTQSNPGALTGWHTIGFTWSSGAITIWLDGTRIANNTTQPIRLPATKTGTFYVGNINAANHFNGLIDSFDLFVEVPTDSEMATFTAR